MRIITTDNELVTQNAGRMDMVAFASDTNMVAVIVNPTSSVKKTDINGLVGTKALVYQVSSTLNNTDMTLISSPFISAGSISILSLPVNSVTIVVAFGISRK